MSNVSLSFDMMPAAREAAKRHPHFRVNEDGDIVLKEGVVRATLDINA